MTWNGSLMEGSGTIRSTTTNAIGEQPVSWAARSEDPRGAVRKVKSGLLGGALGGVVGGVVSLFLRSSWGDLFADRPEDLLWSPSASAFAALGACIGLMIVPEPAPAPRAARSRRLRPSSR